jgi:hypothetical protein
MARYVLIQVDENDRADRLIDKLSGVTGLRIIGLFGKPTQFCECPGPWERSTRGKKYGWYCCPDCGYPRKFGPHQRPRNLLEGDTPETMQNVFLSVREPYLNAMEMHGPTAIQKRMLDLLRTRQIVKDYWAKQPARKRRSKRLRARR